MPAIQPSDHGISKTSISAARPSDAIVHIANVTSDMKAANGVGRPGWSARHARQVSARLSVTSQVPTTTSVRPT